MSTKETNPKDAVGTRKWRQFATVPFTAITEIGLAMLEGARKYGRHNYRVAGVRASVYVDAAMGHIMQWWEGEDIDKDSGLNHITKALATLAVLRDAMINDQVNDDRPPKVDLDEYREHAQKVVDDIFDKYPDCVEPFTYNKHGVAKPVKTVQEFDTAADSYYKSNDNGLVAKLVDANPWKYEIVAPGDTTLRPGCKFGMSEMTRSIRYQPCDREGNLL